MYMVQVNTVYTKRCALTQNHVHAIAPRVGRKKEWTEQLRLPLAEGTTARIDAVLSEAEPRLDMIREAIEREIKRRQRAKPE
jgi:hypothetical protein